MSDRRTRFPTAVGPEAVGATVPFEGGAAQAPVPLDLGDRLSWLGHLGAGAVGEVHRVYDPVLNRTMALKVLRPGVGDSPEALDRFLEEAQATAQLQHPGIVPVHELGTLPDGRRYFTMKEVRGRTLGDVIEEVHEASGPDHWGVTGQGYSLRRLIDIFRQVCDAVAYAHRRGVLHRDLKPDNVMVGAHGEVMVMDWGLARVRAGRAEPGLRTGRSERADQTHVGEVAGTPCFMAPEQARGEQASLGPHSDVYSLGAVLFAILYGEHPYFGFGSMRTVLAVGAGTLPVVPERSRAIPDELLHLRLRAMHPDIEQRPADAGVLAREVTAWLDGSAKRERALSLVEQARASQPVIEGLRRDAAQVRARAAELLSVIPSWAPEAKKLPAWELQLHSRALVAKADRMELEVEQLLQGALGHDPECIQAHVRLAERWARSHRRCQLLRKTAESSVVEAQLRRQIAHLPAHHAVRLEHEAYLRGDATLTVVLDRPDVQVRLLRYVEGPGRLRMEFAGALGVAPIIEATVPHGSYLLQLSSQGVQLARVPVMLERQAHVVVGDERDGVLRLPDDLACDDVWIAPGRTILGGDPDAVGSWPLEQRWVHGFVMKQHAVTNEQYLTFVNDLVLRGDAAMAARVAPREKAGTVGQVGAVIYGRGDDGLYFLREDADGDLWLPDWPVFSIDWHGANAYAEWYAERTGVPWRLPTAVEREKAGRGVDGRIYPWGDRHDPSWSCMRDSRPGRPTPGRQREFEIDLSPYGARGLAGNVRDWCQDGPADDRRYDRGGFWLGNARECRLADCHDHVRDHVAASIGMRLARSV